MKKKHHESCMTDLLCPNTGNVECMKVLEWSSINLKDGSVVHTLRKVLCFGCGKTHTYNQSK